MKLKQLAVIGTMGLCLAFGAEAQTGADSIDSSNFFAKSLGNQYFEIDLGVGVPLFSTNADASIVTPGANLKVGGLGSLKYSAFLDQNWAIGADLGGFIGEGPNKQTFSDVNLGFRTAYWLQLAPQWRMPINLTASFNIMSYKDISYLGFMLKPGFSILYDALPEWSFGLNVDWWYLPEIYTDPTGTPPSSQSRFSHLLEITVSIMYNW